jgi:hypothetical protein
MRFIAIVVGVAFSLSSNPAFATKINGRVQVTTEFRESLAKQESDEGKAVNNYYWNQPNGIISVMPPLVDPTSDLAMVVFKEGSDPEGPDDVTSVDVRTGSLAKTVVVTRPGSTIRFLNVSPFNHELYSPQLSSFKPELQSTKAFRAIEFKEEGVYEVRCKLMPHLSAYVVVTGGKDIELKGDGTFQEELEPGKYTFKVFHGGKWVHKESVDTEGNRNVTVQIKLEPGKEVADEASKPDKGKVAKKPDNAEKTKGKKEGAD